MWSSPDARNPRLVTNSTPLDIDPKEKRQKKKNCHPYIVLTCVPSNTLDTTFSLQGKPIEIRKKKKQRRKPRKLNSLEVVSEDDDETDEDFKDTGSVCLYLRTEWSLSAVATRSR